MLSVCMCGPSFWSEATLPSAGGWGDGERRVGVGRTAQAVGSHRVHTAAWAVIQVPALLLAMG